MCKNNKFKDKIQEFSLLFKYNNTTTSNNTFCSQLFTLTFLQQQKFPKKNDSK